jgi:hypothetical protein
MMDAVVQRIAAAYPSLFFPECCGGPAQQTSSPRGWISAFCAEHAAEKLSGA